MAAGLLYSKDHKCQVLTGSNCLPDTSLMEGRGAAAHLPAPDDHRGGPSLGKHQAMLLAWSGAAVGDPRWLAATDLSQRPLYAACGSQQARDYRLALTYMYSCGPPPACQLGLTPRLPVRGGPIWALPIQTSVSPQPICHSSRPGVVAYH